MCKAYIKLIAKTSHIIFSLTSWVRQNVDGLKSFDWLFAYLPYSCKVAGAFTPGLSLLLRLFISSFLFLIILLFFISPLSALPSYFFLSFLWLFQAIAFESTVTFCDCIFQPFSRPPQRCPWSFLDSLSPFSPPVFSAIASRLAGEWLFSCGAPFEWRWAQSLQISLCMFPRPWEGLAANRWDFIRFHQPWRHNSPKVTLCLIFLDYVNSMSVPVCNGGFTMRWIVKG